MKADMFKIILLAYHESLGATLWLCSDRVALDGNQAYMDCVS